MNSCSGSSYGCGNRIMVATQGTQHNNLYTQHATGGGVTKVDRCTGETRHMLPQYTGEPVQQAPAYTYVRMPVEEKSRVSPCAPVEQPCQTKQCIKREQKTHCYTCGPPKADCYSGDPRCYGSPIYVDGFDSFEVNTGLTSRWNYFIDDTSFIADDGKYKITDEGLLLTATAFEKSWPKPEEDDAFWGQTSAKGHVKGKKGSRNRGIDDSDPNPKGFLDHIKTLPMLDSDLAIPECGQLYVHARMATRIMNGDKHPFGSSEVIDGCSDFRLGYSGICIIDFDSGLLLTHAITNDAHYAIYEVLPFDREEGDCCATGVGRAGFGSAVCIGRRDAFSPQTNFSEIGLAIDRKKGALWYIGNREVHCQPNLGYLPIHEKISYHFPGTCKPIAPKIVHAGFGHFTMLDAFPAVGPATPETRKGLVRLTNFTYADPYDKNTEPVFAFDEAPREARLFNQGASLIIQKFEIQNRC